MRWSLLFLVAILAVLIAEVTALPTLQVGSLELSPERLAVNNLKAAGKAKAVTVKASNFKKFSKMYRNAAQMGKNPAPNGKRMPKDKDDDHIFEAQTMEHAARKGGGSSTTLRPALKAVADRNNDPKNVAFLDSKTNRAKGRAHTAAQSKKTPAEDKGIVERLDQPKAAGKATAADADKISKTDSLNRIWPDTSEATNSEVPYGLSILIS